MILFVGICLSSCANVTPIANERSTVAYEGNSETAGILGFNDDGSLEISSTALGRYNSLIERYGASFHPEIERGFGVSESETGNFKMTLEAAEKWRKMIIQDQRERIDK